MDNLFGYDSVQKCVLCGCVVTYYNPKTETPTTNICPSCREKQHRLAEGKSPEKSKKKKRMSRIERQAMYGGK